MSEQVEGFRLSPQQRHLWRLQQGSDPSGYRVQCALSVEGALDEEALRVALGSVVARFEILRTTVQCLPGTNLPVQVIGDVTAAPVQSCDWSDASPDEQESRLVELMEQERRRPLGVVGAPSLAATLVLLGPSRHALLITMSPMCNDALGIVNLASEIAAAYGARQGGDVPQEGAQDEPLQYADLTEWQNDLLEEGQDRRIEPPAGAQAEPVLLNGSAGTAFRPAVHARVLEPELAAGVAALAHERDVPESTVLLTCWLELVRRMTEGDAVVGVECDGRSYEGLDRALGPFARELPIPVRFDPATPLQDLLAVTDAAVADLIDGQEYFSWEHARGGGEAAAAPYFGVGFGYEDRSARFEGGGAVFSILRCYACTQRHWIELRCARRGDELVAELHHDASRCAASDIDRVARWYEVLLSAAVRAPARPVGELELLDEDERRRVLVEFNETAAEPPPEQCVHALIEAHAREHADRVAVVCGGRRLTYGELDRRAAAVARRLRGLGVGPNVLVGLCVERSVEMLVGITGILKAGGAYVPMDPAYPRERLAFMLEDTRAPVVLTQERLSDLVASADSTVVCLDTDAAIAADRGDEGTDAPGVGPDDLAYLIYTSGSTGRPKGVEVTHRNLVHSTLARRSYYEGAPERYLLLSSFGFDSSVVGIFWTLCEGGTLVVPAEGLERDLHEIRRLITEHRITHTLALPSLWTVVLRETRGEGLGSLRAVIVAGEACPAELVELCGELAPAAALYNEYGPTEATVWSTVHRCRPGSGHHKVPIGRPIPGARVYLLDPARHPVPVGLPGELYVGGPGVARGYLRRPELTAERFVPDPFGGGGRLYRTGDLARYGPDGVIEFLGRLDNQVKVRGYRIELEEIEEVLRSAPSVEEAVVVARRDAGDVQLAAFVVGGDREPAAEELRAFLLERLPEYMVPSAFVAVRDLPRMPNGKVDRDALPELAGRTAEVDHVAPRTPLEELMAGIWAELLHVDRIGVHQSFFQLGGHSLLVTQLVFRMREILGLEMPLRVVFDAPTIAELAGVLQREAGDGRDLNDEAAKALAVGEDLELQRDQRK